MILVICYQLLPVRSIQNKFMVDISNKKTNNYFSWCQTLLKGISVGFHEKLKYFGVYDSCYATKQLLVFFRKFAAIECLGEKKIESSIIHNWMERNF